MHLALLLWASATIFVFLWKVRLNRDEPRTLFHELNILGQVQRLRGASAPAGPQHRSTSCTKPPPPDSHDPAP